MNSFGSIFTGIGAGDYGLELAGWCCCWQSEPDLFRRSVLHRHWPDLPRFRNTQACLVSGCPPVDLVYGELPDTNPVWWEEVFALVAAFRASLWLLEASPVAFGLPEQAVLITRFRAFGYWVTARTVSYMSQMRGQIAGHGIACTLMRRRLFLLAGCGMPARDLTDLSVVEGVRPTSLTPHFGDRPILDEIEVLVGLPIGWSCLCGQLPCCCTDRDLAVKEATVVHLLEWIGRWLLTPIRAAA